MIKVCARSYLRSIKIVRDVCMQISAFDPRFQTQTRAMNNDCNNNYYLILYECVLDGVSSRVIRNLLFSGHALVCVQNKPICHFVRVNFKRV